MIPTDNQPQKNNPVKKKWAKPELYLLDSGAVNGGANIAALEATGHGSTNTPNDHSRQPAFKSWSNQAGNMRALNWTDAASHS